MKLNKQNRRVMGFYRSTFNLDEPYHVLIDGNFLHLATARRLNMLEKLERTLGGKLKPKLTQCVVAELKMLGPEFSGAKVAAKRMHRHECNHTTSVPPAECIKSLVGKRNVGRFCVATQDRELQHELHELGGAPILFVAQSSVLLDNPPSFVKQQLLEDELKFGGLTKQERRAIAEAKKGTSTKRQQKKKVLPKGPNPLSVRKKIKRTNAEKSLTVVSSHRRHRSRAQKRACRLRKAEAGGEGGNVLE
eukprot:c3339_g1_i2.p1 GENE.c3339_g1_i2~~c3339_g1_i2.p1  ORF type:complete len:248 (-),score=57.66 c3339_g1_i2:22-765(-)